MKLHLIFELNSKVLEFEKNIQNLKPKISKIKRTRVKSAHKEPKKHLCVKNKTNGSP
jgi:hypothetical protein